MRESNKENMLKWCEATGHLSIAGGYCCLGVACETAIANGVAIPKASSSINDPVVYGNSTSWLPYNVINWLGSRITLRSGGTRPVAR